MGEDSYGFDTARTRLEDIVTQVRKKDMSLEKSLDLLEEGVRLANQCVELIDHADWESAMAPGSEEAQADGSEDAGSTPEEAAEASDQPQGEEDVEEPGELSEVVDEAPETDS